jgi:hypothetical protein
LAKRSRPDILKEVSYLSTKNSKPTEKDWKDLEHVLFYLNYTRSRSLVLNRPDELSIKVYVDASFLVHPNDCKGHSGGIVMFGNEKCGLITAYSRKQTLMARSSTEAELIAIYDIAKHAKFVQNLLLEITGLSITIRYLEDNISTIRMVLNGGSNNLNTKHIRLRYFLIKLDIDEGKATIEYCKTEEMLADILTKPMKGKLFTKFCDELMGSKWSKEEGTKLFVALYRTTKKRKRARATRLWLSDFHSSFLTEEKSSKKTPKKRPFYFFTKNRSSTSAADAWSRGQFVSVIRTEA